MSDAIFGGGGAMTDEEYYEVAKSGSVSNRLVGRARAQMHRRFMELMGPQASDTVLDFGASEFVEENANFLERHYPYPGQITCAGIGDGAEIKAHFPEVSYQKLVPMEPLPFNDKQFEIAYSNAVLEHVGGAENRFYLIGEISRVARRVFIALPNRYFPVEHHTAIPFLHYSPSLFRLVLSGTKHSYWSRMENLDFIGRGTFQREFGAVRDDAHVEYAGLRVGPFSSNLIGVSNG